MYKKIDLSQIHLYGCSEEAAKGIIDWRLSSKKGISQRVFDHALKVAFECLDYGYDSIDDVFLRWEESGWTGIKYVKNEAVREFIQREDAKIKATREMTLIDESSRAWAKH